MDVLYRIAETVLDVFKIGILSSVADIAQGFLNKVAEMT